MPHSDILVQLQQVSKKYVFDNSEITALDKINCNIYPGDFLVIAGPSGSGKSTLLNMVGCIDKPSEGRLFFGGKDITEIPVEKLNHLRLKHIGFIFQSFNLVPVLTAFENIELPLLFRGLDNKSIKERVEKYLLRVGIAEQLSSVKWQ